MIKIKKINEVFLKITGDLGYLKDISEHFTYKAPNYKFHPLYKNKKWDGNISLFDINKELFYIGIMPELIEFLRENNYEYSIEGNFPSKEFSEEKALEFIKTLNLPIEPRDYQIKYFIKMVRNYRGICLSATNSGKSLIIYLLYRYFNEKTLLIVPSISLVTQMYKDFKDYGYDVENNIEMITGSTSKMSEKQLQISDWQAIFRLKKDWFRDFKVIFGDEVHRFKAKSLKSMMEKCSNAPVRIGLTGTLYDDDLTNLTIKGLFGPICKYTSQEELIKKGYSSKLMIKIINLKYDDPDFQIKLDYKNEMKYILSSMKRQEFIKKLIMNLKGNTLVMFRFTNHGKTLFDLMKQEATIPLFYVDGKSTSEEREEIRAKIETLESSISVCSSVFSTGINIKRINNLILMQPSKSRIITLQSIGRGLRKSEFKNILNVYDIVDDLGLKNITLIHGIKRKIMYKKEQFPYKEYEYKL